MALACGLDLGGTKLLGVVVDTERPGPPLLEERVPTPRGGEAIVDAIVDLAGRLCDQADGDGVTAVGLGAPGLVDRSGTLRMGPNLPGVIDLGLAELLRGRLGLPVVVDNDATSAAWAEHEWGAARGHDHSMTVSLGTGIGAGFTVKGHVLRGANGFAGEPGHMVVDPTGPLCPCGKRGCWERYASGSGLGRLAREAAHAGVAPTLVERAGGEPEDVRGEHVTDAAREGDTAARGGPGPLLVVGRARAGQPREHPRLGRDRDRGRAGRGRRPHPRPDPSRLSRPGARGRSPPGGADPRR